MKDLSNSPSSEPPTGESHQSFVDKKNILVLYDEKYTFINTVREHIESFKKFSKNNIFFAPGTIAGALRNDKYINDEDFKSEKWVRWDLNYFDAVIIHYSVRLSMPGYIAIDVVKMLQAYDGPKILFAQDEYEGVNNLRHYINEIGIGYIYTCVPPEWHEFAYPRALFPGVQLVHTLTGYVPETTSLSQQATPLRERGVLIGYRGRQLPHHYGLLGHEKFIIGERVRMEAQKRGLRVDVESDESKRIYGSWYRFLGSCRATLGTESGSNIFDFDDTLRIKATELAHLPFETVYDTHFRAHEGPARMNQISPKFFEAIALRTALVCFPGHYSGLLERDRHYIALEKDFSNIDEVFEKLQDFDFLEQLTASAYADIIETGKYSYPAFVAAFDAWLDLTVPTTRAAIISAPIAVRRGDKVEPIPPRGPTDYLLNDDILGGTWQRAPFRALFARAPHDPKQLMLTNRATRVDGASIWNSTTFFSPPHDADRLLGETADGDYSAAAVYLPSPQFIDIDLGTDRVLEGAAFAWLDDVNHPLEYQLHVRSAADAWSQILNVTGNTSAACEHVFRPVQARIVRLTATKFSDQQRLLIRRLALYETQPVRQGAVATAAPSKRGTLAGFIRRRLGW